MIFANTNRTLLDLLKDIFMKFSLDKLKGAFGNKRKANPAKTDDNVDVIISDFDDVPFAISDDNVMYAGFGELGGYHFIQTIVVGTLKIKTLKGAKLKINMTDFELNLDSDSTELESDYSSVSGRSITRVDFQIEEEDVLKIEKTRPSSIILTCEKNNLEFEIYSPKEAS